MERYAEYKDSGVEWIGEIPAGWDVAPLWSVERVVAGATPKNEELNWGGSVPWIGPADYADDSHTVSTGARSITEKGLDSCGAQLVPAGSVIVSNRAPIGRVAIAANALCTNQGCKSLIQQVSAICQDYLYWYLFVQTAPLNALGRGTTFIELSSFDLAHFKMPFPSLDEQRAIAAYLDEKTTEIDGLIADVERSIELLQEYRTSIISEAVTKGLDPDAPMKDSGVEWIGEIPAGWKTRRIKQVAKLRTGKTPPTDEGLYFDGDLPWFTPGDLQGFEALRSERNVSEAALKDGMVEVIPCGSTLLVGVGYSTGKSAIATCDCCTNQQLTALIPVAIGSRYLAYAISVLGREMLSLATFNRVPLINNAFVGNLCIPAPPLVEQHRIATYLDEKTAAIDSLVADKRATIDRLREYRKSLISEAVTGAFKAPS